MTHLARRREACLRVRRIVGGVEILLVATNASGRRPLVSPADVARKAIERRVYACQGVARHLKVVEFRAGPAIHGVAGVASGREIRARVAGTRCFLKILQMARGTIGRQSLVLANGGALVTRFTFNGQVRSDEREAVLVLLNLLNGNLPSGHGVTLFTIWAEFAAMNIGVAVGAILANVGEHRLNVALRASNFVVHAAQRIAGLVVIEFRDGPNRFPTRVGVTIFAGDRERSVRTACRVPLSSGNACRGRLPCKKKQPAHNLDERRRNCPLTLDLSPSWVQ